jgi:hypothetical protein
MLKRIHNLRNRMREIRSYGSVGERGGNEPLYPEIDKPGQVQRTYLCT